MQPFCRVARHLLRRRVHCGGGIALPPWAPVRWGVFSSRPMRAWVLCVRWQCRVLALRVGGIQCRLWLHVVISVHPLWCCCAGGVVLPRGSSNGSRSGSMPSGLRVPRWLRSPDALSRGHVVCFQRWLMHSLPRRHAQSLVRVPFNRCMPTMHAAGRSGDLLRSWRGVVHHGCIVSSWPLVCWRQRHPCAVSAAHLCYRRGCYLLAVPCGVARGCPGQH